MFGASPETPRLYPQVKIYPEAVFPPFPLWWRCFVISLTTVGPSVAFVTANLNLTVPVKSPQNCSLKVQGKLRVLLDSHVTTLWHGKTSPFFLYPAAHHPNSTESMADLCCTRGLSYFCYLINLYSRVVSTGRRKLKPSLFILNAIGRYRPKKLLVEKYFYSVYFIRTEQSCLSSTFRRIAQLVILAAL